MADKWKEGMICPEIIRNFFYKGGQFYGRKKYLHNRNSLIIKLLWISLIIALGASMGSKTAMNKTIKIGAYGTIVCLIPTILWKKELLEEYIKYLVTIGLGVFSYFMMTTAAYSSNTFILYFSMIIISIYHDYKPIILSGVIGLALINYLYPLFQDTLYINEKVIIMNGNLVIAAVLIITQTKIGENMRRDLQKRREITEKTKSKLEELLAKVAKSAEQVRDASYQIFQRNQELSHRTQEQSASLQDISSTTEEMNASIQQISSSSNQVDDVSRQTLSIVAEEKEILDETIAAINQIAESSNQIAAIIKVVNDIAFQTNLLALNAAAEGSL